MKKLELKFSNEEEKVVTISIDHPSEPVNEADVNAAMDAIIEENCFYSSGGDLVEKKEARIVERNVTAVEL
ncbi:potassium channel protein [Halobacillus andaensis]|uniref:Potassium channel protein n=1 Tax=Halobacillus andaensis TaxID=1176239 RepID=A0A917B1N9_HALAA|nr:DUF2922 domain-containing protein [Halobacillus andaensis]MBP2003682.1 aromatic ring-opening dioxygenase catalytic subunit (LigB family) [Halobacillus andaensis]GGF12447.1 potassium channel protein [Halobacillus andaensis]